MWIFSIGRVGVLVEASLHIRIWANVQTAASSEGPMCVSHLTIDGAGTRLHNRPGLSRTAHKAHICIVTDTGEA